VLKYNETKKTVPDALLQTYSLHATRKPYSDYKEKKGYQDTAITTKAIIGGKLIGIGNHSFTFQKQILVHSFCSSDL